MPAVRAARPQQPATAFLWRDGGLRRLRWFTATTELPLCGHGTLAAAHVLFESGDTARDETVQFHTAGGVLAARYDGGRIWMDMPAAEVPEAPLPAAVPAALGLDPADVDWFGATGYEYVVRVRAPERVERARPDPAAIAALPVTRVSLTAPGGGPGIDLTSRVFPPKLGLAEDQVTGSAHAVLARLWAGWTGRAELTARQASPRGGELALIVDGGASVRVGGTALTVSRGELLV